MATAENIITLTRQLLREEGTSDVPVVSDPFLFEAIMDGEVKWDDHFQTGGESTIDRQVEDGFDIIADTTLDESSGITSASTDFTIDDENTDRDASDGAVIIWDDNMPDFVNYTTYASKEFTGVTGIAFDHEDEDTVQALYKLPSNFGSFRQSAAYGDGVRLNGVPHYFIQGIPPNGYFSLYDDGTNKFLVIPRGQTGSLSYLYNKAYNTIDELSDVVSVPTRYKYFLVYHCISMAYQDIAGDEGRANNAQARSEQILMRALMNRNTGTKIRTRPMNRFFRDSVTVDGFTYPIF